MKPKREKGNFFTAICYNIIKDYICCTETAGYPQRYKAGRYG